MPLSGFDEEILFIVSQSKYISIGSLCYFTDKLPR